MLYELNINDYFNENDHITITLFSTNFQSIFETFLNYDFCYQTYRRCYLKKTSFFEQKMRLFSNKHLGGKSPCVSGQNGFFPDKSLVII
jgi:hypothetical protein